MRVHESPATWDCHSAGPNQWEKGRAACVATRASGVSAGGNTTSILPARAASTAAATSTRSSQATHSRPEATSPQRPAAREATVAKREPSEQNAASLCPVRIAHGEGNTSARRGSAAAWGAGELCSPRTIAGGYGNPFRVPISMDSMTVHSPVQAASPPASTENRNLSPSTRCARMRRFAPGSTG